MDYLVTMTTHVPDGTAPDAVDGVRAREAARSRELAAQRRLLRLWRPPLRPGEWRTLGLFAAEDAGALENVLASMPLRVWRTDEVMPLAPHPNDPPARLRAASVAGPEFFTWFTQEVPDGLPGQEVRDAIAGEARRAGELAGRGHLERLWRLPDGRVLGLWRAADAAGLRQILDALPLQRRLSTVVTPLSPHPSDPGLSRQ
ncbi:MAG TPA: muconolactone Delta-isomerase family protein [Streptosporangiaceae bacterium]|nr:muconolactone Delta-isomerase family protein [Streptosporangiaceae bacterium]